MSDVQVHFAEDAQLMGYGESDSSGAWLKFQVRPEDLEHFRGLKGTVFYLTLVKRLEDGEPEPAPRKRTHLAEWFGARCRERAFQAFLDHKVGTSDHLVVPDELTRKLLRVGSRAELDTDPEAHARGLALVEEYKEWLSGRA